MFQTTPLWSNFLKLIDQIDVPYLIFFYNNRNSPQQPHCIHKALNAPRKHNLNLWGQVKQNTPQAPVTLNQ